MDDSDKRLLQHLLDGHTALAKTTYEMHGTVNAVHDRLEHLISEQAANAILVDETATKVIAWEAQVRLLAWVATFIGSGGLLSIIVMLAHAAKASK